MKIWTCGSSPQSRSRNTWTRIKNVNGASRQSNFRKFFVVIQIICCRDWWPWTKPGYITMTRRQSNNQWSGGIADHPAPKKFRMQKSAGKVLALIFWDQDGILIIDYLPKRQTINAEFYSSLLVQLKDFWRKNDAGMSPRRSYSCTTMPRLTGHLQPRRKWPTWASSVLITHPTLLIWSRRTTTCSLDWRNKWEVAVFRPTRRSLLLQRPGWTDNSLSGLQTFELRFKKCIDVGGEYVE